jgi:hypothetical protein
VEFQVGMRFFQVLSDLRVRGIELVDAEEDPYALMGEDKRHPIRLKFLPVSRKGPGFRASDQGRGLPEGDRVFGTYDVFKTLEGAHKHAFERAVRNVKCKQHDLAKVRSQLTKAEATLRDVRKAAQHT